MKQSWDKKFRSRIGKTLKRLKRKEHDTDFDELPLQYKLVSLFLINLSGKKKKKYSDAPPVHGNALYYVVNYGDEVVILHPTLLQVYKVRRRIFDKGITDVWWPNDDALIDPNAKNRWGLFCNRFSVADRMMQKLSNFAQRGKLTNKLQNVVREAIADLKGIPTDKVPKFKIAEKQIGGGLKAWQEKVRNTGYRKRLDVDLKRLNKNDEENNLMSKKKEKKTSGSSSAASSSASSAASSSAVSSSSDKKKPSKKPSKKEKTSKKEKSSKKETKGPRGAKTAKAIAIKMMLKKPGKKISLESICKEVQKAKGLKKEFPEKKLLSKVKEIKKWAEKNEKSFKSSSSGMSMK